MVDRMELVRLVEECHKPFEIVSSADWAVQVVLSVLADQGYEIVRREDRYRDADKVFRHYDL